MSRRLIGKSLFLIVLLAAAVWLAIDFLSPVEVQVVKPMRGPAVQAIYATGTVEPGITVRISPRAAGKLIELHADEGQQVSAGQVLARLDNRDLAATVNELEARARYAEQRQHRSKELREKGFISRDQLQQVQAEADAAKAALARAREQSGFMTLKAPAAGRIIRRDGEVGDLIPVNQPIFYLASAEASPRVEADVDEEDIAQIRVDQKALVSAGAFPGKVFHGSVAQITPKGDPVARSYRVRITLPNETPLMIGMTADVNIVIAERQNALLVPSSAVAGNAVWVVQDGKLVKQAVKTGAKGAERTEILSGLSGNESIVAQPPEGLKQGDKVRAIAPPEKT